MRTLIAGSQGFVGEALVKHLQAAGHQVVRLVRRPAAEGEISWAPDAKNAVDVRQLEGFDAVVNLAGVSLGAKRWTEAQRRSIWESRVRSTETLAKAIGRTEFRPSVLVSASAIGYYGDRGKEELDESSSPGTGFLAELCTAWERASQPAADAGIRVANIRTGIVLGTEGGVLAQQIPLFKLCMGGKLGSGEQMMSWISIDDEVAAIEHIIGTPSLSGPVNLTAPTPDTNRYFTKALGEVMRRPTYIPVPRWMLTTAFGAEMVDEMLLAGQMVLPVSLYESGFQFQDETLLPALYRLLRPAPDEVEEDEEGPEMNGKQ